jgi:type II secretory pathway pseudopilin PulG
MKSIRRGERGFTTMEVGIFLVIFLVLIVVVILSVSGVFSGGRAAALDTDLHTVDTALQTYVLKSQGKVPTASGTLPGEGEYALIDFNASFTIAGKTWTFYPDCIKKLPKHHDEGVWRVDSSGIVSVDLAPEDY